MLPISSTSSEKAGLLLSGTNKHLKGATRGGNDKTYS
jgi:hypothetical protein